MTTQYEFTLIVDRDPTDLAEQLFEVGHGDYVPEGPNPPLVHVLQEGPTLPAAIAAAVHAIESVSLAAVGLKSEDLVSVKEVAARLGRTYESVRLLAGGQRGPGCFPTPLSEGQWALYSWAEIADWFATHYGTAGPTDWDREVVAANHVIRARHILAGDKLRAEMAQLMSA
jgi:hypothetical protein